jgi:putative tryptophan/tyrosine transport system substrate-binding protein
MVMQRRELILGLGGVVAALPLAARAQQQAVPMIGWLHFASPDPFAYQVVAFLLAGATEVIE